MKRMITLVMMCWIILPAISHTINTAFLPFASTNTTGANLFAHPWQGKRVAYFGDSITDPRNDGSKIKYWGFLEQWLGITPYVYGVSGRQWDDIPRQAGKLKQEHGDDFDAIM
ncbi:MAG: SGNH/GDSL hydrolase family protein, partial [Prevotella sp.]|nr:SGNH/GDSL hydrolase family protein [Prevotella sp.]